LATILVVEDEQQVRTMIALALESEGFSVLSAGSGSEAIAIAKTCRTKVDLLISDIEMPGMSGADLVDALRAITPDLPVILMSGGIEPVGFGSQRSRFLHKPFSMAALAQIARSLVGPDSADQFSRGVSA
jgi:two-component system, cell cycle sensor histidine kinase and response regulator CckA